MVSQIRPAAVILLTFTVITGLIYPAVVTGLAQVFYPKQANGSLIWVEGRVVGSELIGQPFDEPAYFWGRLSATGRYAYNAAASAGSNFGPMNPGLEKAAVERVEDLRRWEASSTALVPVDLVTASGSGLDPHISVAAARFQIPRVARERGVSESGVAALVESFIQGRQFGFLGEPRVNVLLLNLALDQAYPHKPDGIE